jgi:hypothetical protein
MLAAKRTQGVRSRVIEPRKPYSRERAAVLNDARSIPVPPARGTQDPAGVGKERGARTEGRPGTWEISLPPPKWRADNPRNKSRLSIGLAIAENE